MMHHARASISMVRPWPMAKCICSKTPLLHKCKMHTTTNHNKAVEAYIYIYMYIYVYLYIYIYMCIRTPYPTSIMQTKNTVWRRRLQKMSNNVYIYPYIAYRPLTIAFCSLAREYPRHVQPTMHDLNCTAPIIHFCTHKGDRFLKMSRYLATGHSQLVLYMYIYIYMYVRKYTYI